MADYMFEQVLKQIQTIIIGANFLFLNENGVTTIDEQSWILMQNNSYFTHTSTCC